MDTKTSFATGAGQAAQTSEAGDPHQALTSRNTAMSFQRTRLSADRTLMSVIRTSLSLISFGFTIYQFFLRLQQSKVIHGGSLAPRNFGAVLVYLGVGMIVAGIVYHVQFMIALRVEHKAMRDAGLIQGEHRFPISYTLIVAVVVLLLGLATIGSVALHIGPFD